MKLKLTLFLLITGSVLFGQTNMNIYKNDGTILHIPISQIDSITYSQGVLVGQNYQGGIVVYVDSSGAHGLIAATIDTFGAWGCIGTSVGGTDTIIGSGMQNTIAISAVCSSSVAKLCNDLILGGYSDWYLPSKSEMQILYDNSAVVGLNSNYAYWSSSEDDASTAWMISNIGGQWYNRIKNYTTKVRPVRSF